MPPPVGNVAGPPGADNKTPKAKVCEKDWKSGDELGHTRHTRRGGRGCVCVRAEHQFTLTLDQVKLSLKNTILNSEQRVRESCSRHKPAGTG